jgi:hypothetical protein
MRIVARHHIAVATLFIGANALFNCVAKVRGIDYDLTGLQGIHAVTHSQITPPSTTNTTWFLNPCGKIDSTMYPDDNTCPDGTQVCGVTRVSVKDQTLVSEIIPVSGDFDGSVAGTQVSQLDNNVGGLHVEFLDGRWGDKEGLKASVDFVCSKDKESPLEFVDWDGDVLSLQIHSRYACPLENDNPPAKNPDDNDSDEPPAGDEPSDGDDSDNSSHWGFFTWLFIVGVLGFGLYVVFTAWFNYNRYGLSGVDLLPHSDTVRDLPYLVRDFGRKVMSTFAGGPSRGGYSAV